MKIQSLYKQYAFWFSLVASQIVVQIVGGEDTAHGALPGLVSPPTRDIRWLSDLGRILFTGCLIKIKWLQ